MTVAVMPHAPNGLERILSELHHGRNVLGGTHIMPLLQSGGIRGTLLFLRCLKVKRRV
jgi:hypothetical protein